MAFDNNWPRPQPGFIAINLGKRVYYVDRHCDEIWGVYPHPKIKNHDGSIGFQQRRIEPSGHLAWKIRKKLKKELGQ